MQAAGLQSDLLKGLPLLLAQELVPEGVGAVEHSKVLVYRPHYGPAAKSPSGKFYKAAVGGFCESEDSVGVSEVGGWTTPSVEGGELSGIVGVSTVGSGVVTGASTDGCSGAIGSDGVFVLVGASVVEGGVGCELVTGSVAVVDA